MSIAELPVTLIRGGTSRAAFLRLPDLPESTAERDRLCLNLIGSPDPQAVDGLGGGVSSNSKVMAVGTPSEHPDCPAGVDLVSLFAQVSPTEPSVDWSGNCGNISSAITAFALHRGLLHASGDRLTCRVWNANTDSVLELSHPLVRGRLPDVGDFHLDGVDTDGARIDVRFLHPGGEKSGLILPHGPRTVLPGSELEVSLVDIANPIVMLRAGDVGVDPTRPSAELNADAGLLDRLESIRGEAAVLLGLSGPVLPRVAIIGRGDQVPVIMTSVGRVHHALPATGILALGGAIALGGTVADRPAASETVLRHPKGTVTVSAAVSASGDELEWVALARTARIIMDGTARIPR